MSSDPNDFAAIDPDAVASLVDAVHELAESVAGGDAGRLPAAVSAVVNGLATGSISPTIFPQTPSTQTAPTTTAAPPHGNDPGSTTPDPLGHITRVVTQIRDAVIAMQSGSAPTGGGSVATSGSPAAGDDRAKARGKRFWAPFGRSVGKGVKEWAGGTKIGRATKGLREGVGQLVGGKTKANQGVGLATAAGGAVAALYELGKAGVALAYQQEQQARRLAEYSPSQAVNLAQLDTNRVMRDMDRGEATAGSSGQLTESIDRFEKAILPVQKLADDVSNVIGSGVLDAISTGAELLDPILEGMRDLAKALGIDLKPRTQPEVIPFGDWLKGLHDEEELKAKKAQDRIDRLRNPGRRP